jgi:hypothetical protein
MLTTFKITYLRENSRQGDRKFGISASTLIRAFGGESDMGLVVMRIKVLSIPATWEVELSTDTAGALDGRKLVVPH